MYSVPSHMLEIPAPVNNGCGGKAKCQSPIHLPLSAQPPAPHAGLTGGKKSRSQAELGMMNPPLYVLGVK